MRTSHGRIEKLIREKWSSITDEELFGSPSYAAYLTDISEVISGRYDRELRVEIICDSDPNASLAYTDNQIIRMNALNKIVQSMESRPLKALSLIGFCAHELGHILYTDFPAMIEYQEQLLQGRFWPEEPEVPATMEHWKRELLNALKSGDKAESATIIATGHSFFNILEDMYVERQMCEEYPGQFRSGILLNSSRMLELGPSVCEQVKNSVQPLSVMKNMLLNYCRKGNIHNLGGYTGEYLDALMDCIPIVDAVKTTDNGAGQKKAVSWLMVRIWPYIKESVANVQEKMMREQTMEEVIKEILKELLQGLHADTPNGKTAPAVIAAGRTSADSDPSIEKERSEIELILSGKREGESRGFTEAEKAFDSLFRETVRKSAVRDAEQELANELQEEAQRINYGEVNRHIAVKVERMRKVPPTLVKEYQELFPELKPISKRLQNSVANMLKDMRGGGKLDGLLMGKKFDTHRLYRKDCRNFYNLRLPEETELAVALLVDESGSMGSQNRWEYARKAAMVLNDFCAALGLPHMVYGHDDSGSVVRMYVYAEFDSVDGMDKFRMMDIHDREENRDGVALRYVAERLLKRPESKKLLIVVSDGAPSAPGYWGKTAEADLRKAKREYTKKGITVFAAAIGEDRKAIQRIYGDGFLDISDLAALPVNLSKLIMKFLK